MDSPLRLGRYSLVKLLGRGGMGRVYEAVLHGPAGFRKQVAIKVLDEGGDGLQREARLGGLLKHPNLVDTYELGQAEWTDGSPVWFVAMELVTGGAIDTLVPMPGRAVVDVGRQVCAGLAHAHEQVGLVHLDLKPQNLLVDSASGLVKVADLGIARAQGFDDDGRVRGTPAYMSPEQMRGRAVDARSDLYSLGLVLFELATGRRVYEGLARPEPDLSGCPWLEPVLRRCLEPDPHVRIESADELAALLGEVDAPSEGLAELVGSSLAVTRTTDVSATPDTYRFTLGEARARTNLGEEPDRFVGRERELSRMAQGVRDHRLVTLKGAGGTGKTRLARRFGAAHHLATGRPVWFVDLSEAEDRDDIVRTVAKELEVPLKGGEHQVAAGLEGRGELVVVLDNLEQVVSDVGVVADWLDAAPQLRVVATSRVPLGLDGEEVIELGPLSEDEAVELLRERARQDPGGTEAVRELVRRLDGLPLALELAAARIGLLSVEQVLGRLDRRFSLLRGRGRGRHATLRGTIAWSWDLLEPWERAALAQLSVFRGGIRLDLADAVLDLSEWPEAPWAMDVVGALHERSLLYAEKGSEPRFRMYESVRAFAGEHLVDRDATRLRHLVAFAPLGDPEAQRALHGRRAIEAFHALAAEQHNLAAAVDAGLDLGEPELAASALVALGAVLERGGVAEPVLERIERVLSAGVSDRRASRLESQRAWLRYGKRDLAGAREAAAAARALAERSGDGHLLRTAKARMATVRKHQGDTAGARRLVEEVLVSARRAGDRYGEARVLTNLALLDHDTGDVEAAQRNFGEALELLRALGDRHLQGNVLGGLASLQRARGQLEQARGTLLRALKLSREAGARSRAAIHLLNLGNVLVDLGRGDEAERAYRAAVEATRELGDRQHAALSLNNLGNLMRSQGRTARAEDCYVRSLAISRGLDDPVGEASTLVGLGNMHLEAGRTLDARTAYARAYELIRARGNPVWTGLVQSYLAGAYVADDPANACAMLDEVLERLDGRHPMAWARALGMRGEARLRLGDEEGAVDLDRAERTLVDVGDLVGRMTLGMRRARVALERGRTEEVEEHLAGVERLADEAGLGEEAPIRLEAAVVRQQLSDGP